ncbi:extracellular serine proteinase-like [Amphiura filiformis]|uniref:extracellular serine proteinase-like n=1 Tax=Amphiura filiformis TaxID=82378 RepID=UPI003B2213B3
MECRRPSPETIDGDGTNTHIYVVDSGIHYGHEDFTGRTGDGIDLIGDPQIVGVDCFGHGTHVAGIAAGTTYGIATNATLHSIRIFGCVGFTPDSLIITALEWIAENAMRPAILSMSFGTRFSQAMYDTAESLVKEGFVLSVSAGNDNLDACEKTPAAAPSVITVAASDIEDVRAWWSNIGRCIDIIAPGVDTVSTINADNGTSISSGTSFSSPIVTGKLNLVALEPVMFLLLSAYVHL